MRWGESIYEQGMAGVGANNGRAGLRDNNGV